MTFPSPNAKVVLSSTAQRSLTVVPNDLPSGSLWIEWDDGSAFYPVNAAGGPNRIWAGLGVTTVQSTLDPNSPTAVAIHKLKLVAPAVAEVGIGTRIVTAAPDAGGTLRTFMQIDATATAIGAGAATTQVEIGILNVNVITVALTIKNPVANDDTSLTILRRQGGVTTLQPVTQGIADSGGVGFKLLAVPN